MIKRIGERERKRKNTKCSQSLVNPVPMINGFPNSAAHPLTHRPTTLLQCVLLVSSVVLKKAKEVLFW
jgi:hypothetical protein